MLLETLSRKWLRKNIRNLVDPFNMAYIKPPPLDHIVPNEEVSYIDMFSLIMVLRSFRNSYSSFVIAP